MNSKVKGYILAAISAATYGMNPLFALPLYEDGMDLFSVLFFRYLFAIPILGVMLRLRRRDFSIKKSDIVPLLVLGVLFAMSSITLFSSYNYMDAGIASTILFVYPIMVALIMFIFFKEKISKMTMTCIAVAMVGIVLLCKSDEGAVVSTTEAIQCIGSTPTAILGILEPVTAVFFGVVVFGEVLTPRIVLGLILVFTSVTFVVAGGNISKILLRLKKMFPKLKQK